MTQPAVTFQIKQLEEHFNTRLFDRGHGKISLTPAGDVVLDYAERILGLSSELDVRLAEMTGEIGGPLLVGASTTIAEFMLPHVLGQFKARYPTVKPRLIVGNSETIETRVAEHTLDIGLIESHSHQPTLQCEICCEDELLVICNPRFPLARHREVTPELMLGVPYVSREPGSGTREFIDSYLRAAGMNLDAMNLVMELGSPEALKGVVESGVGFAIVSHVSVVKEKQLGTLITLPLKPALTRTLSLVFPKERFRSRLVSTFVEFAREKMRGMSVTPA